ncbi:MAG: 4-hydroxy-tetrahydrodipicolinate reductase [Armatimonadota bacterium]
MKKIRVAVAGARGRMGAEVFRALSGDDGMEVVAEIELGDDLESILRNTKPDAMVDFTVPDSCYANILTALDCGVVPLVGTTGLSAVQLDAIRERCSANRTGCLVAPNFALGAVLMMRFSAEAAKYLPDVEILEFHHERKVDAPSGTAVKTAEMIAASREGAPASLPDNAFEVFEGARGGSAPGDIPVHSIRLPGYVASQEVVFGAPGQRLSIRHDSIDRTSFMPGVLLAVRKARSLDGLVHGLEHLLQG